MQRKIDLNKLKHINLFNVFESVFGAEFVKKKSSKYGRYYKLNGNRYWVRFDYRTGKYFYTSLDNDNDKGTIIDFIQNNIICEKNIGKVVQYLKQKNIIQ